MLIPSVVPADSITPAYVASASDFDIIWNGPNISLISDRRLADKGLIAQQQEDHRPNKGDICQLECKLQFQLFRLSATSLTTRSGRAYSNPVIKADEIGFMTSWLDMASAYS